MKAVEKAMLDDYSPLGEKDLQGRQSRYFAGEGGCCRVKTARRTTLWTFSFLVAFVELQDESGGEK
jgi:hypothetical protein